MPCGFMSSVCRCLRLAHEAEQEPMASAGMTNTSSWGTADRSTHETIGSPPSAGLTCTPVVQTEDIAARRRRTDNHGVLLQ